MTDPATLVLRLELDRNAEPIRGLLKTAADDLEVPFTGWVGLAAAIETALGEREKLGDDPS